MRPELAIFTVKTAAFIDHARLSNYFPNRGFFNCHSYFRRFFILKTLRYRENMIEWEGLTGEILGSRSWRLFGPYAMTKHIIFSSGPTSLSLMSILLHDRFNDCDN